MMKDTLREVLAPFGPSGGEAPIAKVLANMVRPHVDSIQTDALGNLICTKKGTAGGKRIMFSAHMDTIGYIVVDADKEGFLRVANIGGVNPASAAGRHVVLASGLAGVVSGEPLHGADKPSMQKLFVDIGAASREEALEKAPVGTLVAIAHQFTDLGDRVSAPYMDDRAACAVLVELMRALDRTAHEVVAVFSTQEEVGCRGAGVAAFAIEPDIGVAIDVTPTGDTPGADTLPVKVGEGPAVKIKDNNSIATPVVRDGLVKAAKEAGVPFQYEVLHYGGTDAGAIMTSRGGVPSGTLSLACRYVHSPVELVSIRDLEQAVALLKAYVEKVV